MKRRALFVILGLIFSMMLAGCMKEIAPGTEQGFLVRITPSGKVVNAIKWDGSEVKYHPDEKKRLPGARIVFYTEGQREPYSFLKKVDGKWKKDVWKEGAAEGASDPIMEDVKQGIVVHISPEGNILRVTNYDGTEAQYAGGIDFSKGRLVSRSVACCWRATPSGLLCLCGYCWWGCPK